MDFGGFRTAFSALSLSKMDFGGFRTAFCYIFFTITIVFSLFSLLLYVLRLLKPCCNCDTCMTYLTHGWSTEFNNLSDWYTHLLRKSQTQTVHVHVLGCTITANPENVEHLLKTRFENYPKGKQFSAILGDLLGRGIFNVDGDSWRFQRKMASLEVGSVSARAYAFDVVSWETKTRLIPLLSLKARTKNEVVDLQNVFQRFSFDTICKFSFGFDPKSLDLLSQSTETGPALAFDNASKLSAERAMLASPLIWKAKRMFNLGSEKRLKEAIKEVNVLAEEVIKQKRIRGFSGDMDLLSRFMGQIDDDKYLRDVVISFLLAGRDTVAAALSSFFWLLSKNPHVEEAIRQEAERVSGHTQDPTHGPIPRFEEIRNMHYLHAAVHECLRLYPPVQFDSKFSEDDDVLPDGTFIGKGTRVMYHPYAMGRMENLWGPDCLVFRPERWMKNGVFSPENPFKFPVFQAGLRVCLGRELAIMEIKTVVLALIQRFDIRVMGMHLPLRFAPGLTASIRGGLPVMVQERQFPS